MAGPRSQTTIRSGPKQSNGLERYLPILGSLPVYKRAWLRGDLPGALTVAALLIPEGIAYAQLAGMPPQAAFYTAPVGLVLYAIFGTSRQLVVAVSAEVAVIPRPRPGIL